jgi:hypothetical protein
MSSGDYLAREAAEEKVTCIVRATDGDGEQVTIRCHDAKEALRYAKECLAENYKKITLEIGGD